MGHALFGKEALPLLQGMLADEVDYSGTEDVDAAHAGTPFVDAERHVDDWVEWVDWERVSGGAGPSSS